MNVEINKYVTYKGNKKLTCDLLQEQFNSQGSQLVNFGMGKYEIAQGSVYDGIWCGYDLTGFGRAVHALENYHEGRQIIES